MNEINFMKALGDIPEDIVKCYFDESITTTNTVVSTNTQIVENLVMQKEQKQALSTIKHSGEIIMDKNKKINFCISKASIAAVLAVCIGLNAAIIYGIFTMRKDSDTFTTAYSPEVQNITPLHMELVDAMPTGVSITFRNYSENICELPLSAEILQNDNKIAMSIMSLTEVTKYTLEPEQSCDLIFSFDELPPGAYTLRMLDIDKETLSAFGSIDFEISEGYTEMIYIPDMTGMLSETAISNLNNLNIEYDIINSPHSDEQIDHVITALPTPYKTIESAGIQQQYYHYDGNGYWIKPTDRIKLEIAIHDEREPVILPDMKGWDYETAVSTILSLELYVDVRHAYSDEVPKGKIIAIDPEGPIEIDRHSTIHIVNSLGSNNNEMHIDEDKSETSS